jgi:hypothetical protein
MKDVEQFEKEVLAKQAREHEKIMYFKALQEEQVADKEARVRRVRLRPPLQNVLVSIEPVRQLRNCLSARAVCIHASRPIEDASVLDAWW